MSYRLISVKPWMSYSNCTVQGNTEGRRHMRTSDASYLAGFFDGDGSLYFQLVRQEEYRFGYYIRVSISFSQVTSSRVGLEHVRAMIDAGYVRDRGTGMSDLVITSRPVVQDVLTNMQPFVIFKRAQVREALRMLPMIRPPHVERRIPAGGAPRRCLRTPKPFESRSGTPPQMSSSICVAWECLPP